MGWKEKKMIHSPDSIIGSQSNQALLLYTCLFYLFIIIIIIIIIFFFGGGGHLQLCMFSTYCSELWLNE